MAKRRTAIRSAKHASHSAEATAANKKLFLAALERGCTPGVAAKNIKVSYSTVYRWKSVDEKFAEAWVEAVETGLDELEYSVYQRGLKEGGEDARFILRGRRRDVFGHADAAHQPERQSNMILRITLQEQYKRLERLGIPLPAIETDYEEVDAADDTKADQS